MAGVVSGDCRTKRTSARWALDTFCPAPAQGAVFGVGAFGCLSAESAEVATSGRRPGDAFAMRTERYLVRARVLVRDRAIPAARPQPRTVREAQDQDDLVRQGRVAERHGYSVEVIEGPALVFVAER